MQFVLLAQSELEYEIYVSISDQNCQNVISILPNLPERFSSYNMSLGDPLISDHLLEEGWYRTEDHYMPTIDSGATINSFGTYYPIVVSGKSHHKLMWIWVRFVIRLPGIYYFCKWDCESEFG